MTALRTSGPITPPKTISFFRRTSINITLIGSGNVAWHMGRALVAAGHRVVQVWSRTPQHAANLASQLGAGTAASLDSLDPHADLYLLAVSDSAIQPLSSALPPLDGVVAHTSGATPLSAISSTRRQCGVLWSPQTFVAGVPMNYADLIFCIEGSSQRATALLQQLAASLTPHTIKATSEQRLVYHLAAVMVNNFGNALNAMAEQLLNQHGASLDLLRPIIRQTALNAEGSNLWQLQTGPAVRNDTATINAHRTLLQNMSPDLLPLYDTFTHLIAANRHNQQ